MGQLSEVLTRDKDRFHQEKDEILSVALKVSSFINVDDTGARHDGKNGYCTHVGNDLFPWFESTDSKSRINFLRLLRAGHEDYRIDDIFTQKTDYRLSEKDFGLRSQSLGLARRTGVRLRASLPAALPKSFSESLYQLLNLALRRLHDNKQELLLVLERPEIPLHNNLGENDIREYVKRRKISGSTRSATGRRCRDTFTSLKKTSRKLGVSFWHFLLDRTSNQYLIPPLPQLIAQQAGAP